MPRNATLDQFPIVKHLLNPSDIAKMQGLRANIKTQHAFVEPELTECDQRMRK